MRLVTAAEMRELDRLTIEKYGTPGHVLMERAGGGATQALLQSFPHLKRGKRVVIIAGRGNNGGDGFVMARMLAKLGLKVDVFLLGRASELKGDAQLNFKRLPAKKKVVEVHDRKGLETLHKAVSSADAVVDAIFGTGLKNAVEGIHAEVIAMLNATPVHVFAVDIPSGLDSDTGRPLGTCVVAQATATFGFFKVGHMTPPGPEICGGLYRVEIGIAEEAIEEVPASCEYVGPEHAALLIPSRSRGAHKGTFGHVLVLGGSFGKTGAAILAAKAALRAGAGLVTLAGPASQHTILAGGVYEAMTEVVADRDGLMLFDARALERLVEGKSAVVVGPGMGTHEDAERIVHWLLEREGLKLLVDADALNCLARDTSVLARAKATCVLTPHPGEMARLTNMTPAEVQFDRMRAARTFANDRRCVVVLKGAGTITAAPDGFCWLNSTGNPGMASGGMGDALSGIIGALLGQGLEPAAAARLGVFAHGEAGDFVAEQRGEMGLIASDVISALSFERWQPGEHEACDDPTHDHGHDHGGHQHGPEDEQAPRRKKARRKGAAKRKGR